jgi:hypothetical protein
MYLTPGGVRAWNLTSSLAPDDLAHIQTPTGRLQAPVARVYEKSLGSDPLYSRFSQKSGIWASRLSGKRGRSNDFIAYPLTRIGTAPPNPKNVELVRRYHDIPIVENRYVSGASERTPPQVIELFRNQLRGLPSTLVDPVGQRLTTQGMLAF